MSTASLPSYHFDPQDSEQRLAQHLRSSYPTRPNGSFVKNSRSGGVALRLSGQDDRAELPEYGRGASVEGTVEIVKSESVLSVEVKIEGSLKLKEIAEGGTSSSMLCLDVKTLWSKDANPSQTCPTSVPFSLTLPATFFDGKANYPLPPTYEAHLSGVPGFHANIDYRVSAVVARSRGVSFFGLANSVVTTPFVYRPRSRPALPLPSPLLTTVPHPSLIQSDNWSLFQGTLSARSSRNEDITAMLYLPNPRVLNMTEAIPFHLIFASSPQSLAAFLPYSPVPSRTPPTSPTTAKAASPLAPSFTPNPFSSTSYLSPNPISSLASASASSLPASPTRVQLLRQSAVDVRSITKRTPLLPGNKTDIWKTSLIGEGAFWHDGAELRSNVDGQIRGVIPAERRGWMAYSGEIAVDPSVRVAGFKASGLTVRDFIVLSTTPPDLGRAAFSDLRVVVPVRLTTDPWTGEPGGVYGAYESSGSEPSLAEGNLAAQPEMEY